MISDLLAVILALVVQYLQIPEQFRNIIFQILHLIINNMTIERGNRPNRRRAILQPTRRGERVRRRPDFLHYHHF